MVRANIGAYTPCLVCISVSDAEHYYIIERIDTLRPLVMASFLKSSGKSPGWPRCRSSNQPPGFRLCRRVGHSSITDSKLICTGSTSNQ